MELYQWYEYTIDGFQYGLLPEEELKEIFKSGRISSVLIEHVIAHLFTNVSKHGCTQGKGADHFISIETIKNGVTSDLEKPSQSKSIKNGSGWTTKSGLLDSKRGSKKSEKKWDEEHNSYFTDYEYFMYIKTDHLPKISFVLIETNKLATFTDEIIQQATDMALGKRKNKQDGMPNWKYPCYINEAMLGKICKPTVTIINTQ